ncbi:MAG TPA: cation:proton antiporter [Miltoncostaeaceae bacterium]|nr:cation:proton antiporter [Miltoncostaeaceae bacterium]
MDENAAGLAVLLVVVVVYSAAARRLDRLSVTSAIVFTAAGLALGTEGLDILPLSLSLDAETTKLLAESALVVLLFADASTVDARAAGGDAALVGRLLGIGLPLAVGIGALLAAPLLPELSWAACALLAAMLAPTDAALGLSMFRNRAVPARVRRVLNVESGLNDGVATPVVFFAIAVVVDEASATSTADAASAIAEAARDLALGVGVGAAVGAAGGLLLLRARARGWTTPESEEIGILALAALTYTAALAAGANGFVAAFAGGLALGAVTRRALRERTGVTDDVGQVLALLVWTLFGSLLVGPVLADGIDWAAIAYAVLSLTVVRMVAVALALAGTGFRWQTVALMGWFGPRGLASGVFLLIVVIELEGIAPDVAETIAVTGTWTILLSVLLHGLTAGPLGRAYGRRAAAFAGPAPEREAGPEPRTRRRHMAT